jgi:hypothetical protein
LLQYIDTGADRHVQSLLDEATYELNTGSWEV